MKHDSDQFVWLFQSSEYIYGFHNNENKFMKNKVMGSWGAFIGLQFSSSVQLLQTHFCEL